MNKSTCVKSITQMLMLDATDADGVASLVEQIEDPRIARIEALLDERRVNPDDPRMMGQIWPSEIRAILDGGAA